MQLPCHFIFISSHGSDFHFRFHSSRRVMEQAQTEFYASDAKLGCPGPRLPQEASGCSQRMYLHVLSEQCQSSDRRQTSQCGFSSSFLCRQSCTWAFSLELSFGHLSCLAYLRVRLHSDPASPALALSSTLFSVMPRSPHNRSTHISYTCLFPI